MPGRTLERLYETGTTGSQIIAAPATSDGALFVTATNGVLYALNVG
jgi:outer membrane protein assembly factor BamB